MGEGGSTFGVSEFHGQTTLHPLGLTAMLVCGVALLLLPRRHAVLPMLIVCCFVAVSQRIVIGGADFSLLRIMVIFGALRVLLRQEYRGFRPGRLDALLCCWLASGAMIYVVREGTTEAVINRSGWIFDGAGMYFLFRYLVREWKDVIGVGFALTIIAIPVAILFFVEKSTGRNLFAVFGGVPEFTSIREGKLRCRGAFPHPIMAGTFWAVAVPFIALQWWTHPLRRPLVVVGAVCALGVVVFTASSGPLASAAVVFMMAALYPLRRHAWSMLGGAACLLVALHFAMNKPVWHLFARMDLVGGSTGWHRYKLIDVFLENPDKWFMLGSKDASYLAVSSIHADITNQYILEATRGGALALLFYLLMIFAAMQLLLRARAVFEGDKTKTVIIWGVLTAFVVHLVSFTGVSYFGQIIMLWFLTLAMAGSIGEWAFKPRAAAVAARNPRPLQRRGAAHA